MKEIVHWKCYDCGLESATELETEVPEVWLAMRIVGCIHDQLSENCLPHVFARILPINIIGQDDL